MPRLEKETYRGIEHIEAEIHWARDMNNPQHLKVIKKHLDRLQETWAEAHRDLMEHTKEGERG